MNDFNFFEPYLVKGKQPSASSFNPVPLICLLLALLAAWPLFNLGRSIQLKHEAASLEAEITGSEKYPLLAQADAQKQYIEQLQSQLTSLSNTDSALKNSEWLNEPFLFSLLSTVPKDLRVEDLSISPEKKVELSGSTSNKPAIAELEHNIRDTGRFESLYVQTISNQDDTYSFKMEFSLKGVGADATN